MNEYKQLEKTLSSLITLALSKDSREQRHHLSPVAYCREFKTLKLGLPRQSGMTTATLKLLPKFWKRPLWIAGTKRMADYTQKIAKEHSLLLGDVVTGQALRTNSFEPNPFFDCVVVDPSSFIQDKVINSLYNHFYPYCDVNQNFLFILIG